MNKVLKQLLERRDAATTELEGILRDAEGAERDDLTEDEEKRSGELLAEVDELDGRIGEEKAQAEKRQMVAEARALVAPTAVDAAVVDEPMVYGEGSPNSYFADFVRFMGGPQWHNHQDAGQRLAEWSHQVEREIAAGSREGRAFEVQAREEFRGQGEQAPFAMRELRERGRVAREQKAEQRAITTGGGATASAAGGGGAAFVTPVFFVADYAPYRENGRAFIDQCNGQPLPDYGMDVYIPHVTGPAAVASQTEGNAVTETDPSAGYLSGQLITEAGQVTVSQQLLDRAGPNFSFDKLIFDQLNRDYAPKVDTYVLTQALAAATSQQWSGNAGAFVLVAASGAGGFYGQVSKAKASVKTTAGTVLNPTHLFLPSDRWEYIAAWADTQGRPLVVPDYAGAINAAAGGSDGTGVIEGRTGYRFNGLPAFTDQNIPTVGTANSQQALVGDLSEIYVFEGQKVPRVIPQTLASNLQVLLQLYAYITAIVRYPSGIVTINGSALAGAISYTN